MRTKITLFILSITLIFSGCFSPWAGGEGTLTISIGGGNGQARAVGSSWLNGLNSEEFLHVITLTGPGQKQEARCIGSKSTTFTVETGRWNVKVRAYDLNGPANSPDNLEQIQLDDLTLVAVGSADVNVKTGSNFVAIKMGPPSEKDLLDDLGDDEYYITVGVITGQNGWLDINCEAKGDLVYGKVQITYYGNTYYQNNGRIINNGNKFKKSDTVKIEAINETKFVFKKWVLLYGATTIPSNGSAINYSPFSVSATINDLFASNNLGDTKAICLLAVFDGDGDFTPKNIMSKEELAKIGKDSAYLLNGYYALMTDLVISESWTPIGSGVTTFNGIFNGMGHTITYALDEMKNVSNISSEECAGLFGVIGNIGRVKNLILEGSISNVAHADKPLYIGAVAGENKGMIFNVVSFVDINFSTSATGTIYAGGIAGKNTNSIDNCAGVGAIGNNTNSSIDYGGGIVGLISDGMVYCCWASGAIDIKKANGYAGGIAGRISTTSSIYSSYIRNCLAVNSSITNTGTPSNAGRIVGDTPSLYCELSNNYADVNYFNIPTGGAIGNNTMNGETVSSSNYGINQWWNEPDKWSSIIGIWNVKSSSLDADEGNPWVMNHSETRNSQPLKLWFNIN